MSSQLMGLYDGLLGTSYDEECLRYQQIAEIARKPDENSRKITKATIEGASYQPPFYLSPKFIEIGISRKLRLMRIFSDCISFA
jgi:hypothetical protein